MRIVVRTGAVLLAAWAGCGPALAAGPSTSSRNVTATLLSDTATVEPGKAFRVGVRLQMAPGWHTYWKYPGDSGLPTKIAWTLPDGSAAGPLQWPAPQRLPAGPLVSFGYEQEVLLVSEITPPARAAGAATVAARLSWLECKEACLPAKGEVEITLPVGPAAHPSADAALFAATARRVPVKADGWRLSAGPANDGVLLQLRPPHGAVRSAFFFPDTAEVIDVAAEQKLQGGPQLLLQPATNPRTVSTLTGVLVVEGPGAEPAVLDVSVPLPPGALASRAAGPVATVPAPETAPPPAVAVPQRLHSLPLALGLAFLGGLILNLMPCVLPVLSLKVLGFVRHGGAAGGAWRHGLAFTAGVVVSFWALAGLLLVLRTGGRQVGWGFQLQSPPFLAGLAVLFFLMGLNLFGVFEVGQRLTAVGNVTPWKEGLAGSVSSGALATIVATPCTAPFMGSALGFALGQPASVAFLTFTALALGMASPYLLLSCSPGLLRYVPRPGAWMERFKQVMGFLMMATVVALVWLFGQHTGTDGMARLLGGFVVVGMGAWVYGQWAAWDRSPRSRVLATLGAAALVAAGLALGLVGTRTVARASERSAAGGPVQWEPWSPERVAELRRQGRPVFVDFTAAWCLTCQVNERVALGAAPVVERFRRAGIVTLRADWTSRDDAITRALLEHGRQGVPLYVLYGTEPAQPPIVLPELLTQGVVLDALDRALSKENRT